MIPESVLEELELRETGAPPAESSLKAKPDILVDKEYSIFEKYVISKRVEHIEDLKGVKRVPVNRREMISDAFLKREVAAPKRIKERYGERDDKGKVRVSAESEELEAMDICHGPSLKLLEALL